MDQWPEGLDLWRGVDDKPVDTKFPHQVVHVADQVSFVSIRELHSKYVSITIHNQNINTSLNEFRYAFDRYFCTQINGFDGFGEYSK